MSEQDLFGKCPYVTTQKLLSGKWSIYILHLLSSGSLRFNELLRLMPEKMTHTTLSRQLKFLEEKHIISRREYKQIPPKVEYSLSKVGISFITVLKELEKWGGEYISMLKEEDFKQTYGNE